MKTIKARVFNKMSACKCGCHGADPWHRASYKRVITLDPECENVGTVRMPYSTQPVRVVRTNTIWIVDQSSIVFDK